MSPPGTYFVIFTTSQRRRLFVVESYARLFLKTMYAYRRQAKFQLHAFVLMPEHVHLLLTPASDLTLERSIQFIKGGYSRAFGIEFGSREVWQRGFTDHRIRDADDFAQHRDYIHQNPVKRGLAESAKEYRYCSAFPGFKLDERTSAAKAAVHEWSLWHD
jgi:putative transposase